LFVLCLALALVWREMNRDLDRDSNTRAALVAELLNVASNCQSAIATAIRRGKEGICRLRTNRYTASSAQAGEIGDFLCGPDRRCPQRARGNFSRLP
jgi:hypothetical protein